SGQQTGHGAGDRFSDLFGGLFGRGGTTRTGSATRPRRGQDIESEVTLSFTEAAEGATVSLRLTSSAACAACTGTGAKAGTTPRVCPTCEGTGAASRNLGSFAFSEPCRDCKGRGLLVDDPCPVCEGSGRAKSTRTIQARIPAGVADGQRVRLKGKGAPGENGGPAGDLYIVTHVKPHAVFGRSGDNLTVTVPVTFSEAALGAEIKVPTLKGMPVTLRIPPGTPNGRTFRIRGRGVTRKDGTKGDLLATAEVVVPKTPGPGSFGGPEASEPMDARSFDRSDAAPVYVISVAAQLSGLHPQTLRQYDRLGLVSPGRTAGRGRLYSTRDIIMLREVQRLSQEEGINLAGIKRILELETETLRLREEVHRLRAELQTIKALIRYELPPGA